MNKMVTHLDRVVVLVDMDCFYCQVEEKLNPTLVGKPIAVAQYNAWRGGGLIAVNYPARDKGVTRHMRGDEAKKICPNIELVRVPNIRGKADLTKYREAGKRVAEVLKSFTNLLQRASVDEAYLDITERVDARIASLTTKITVDDVPNTYVTGCEVKSFINCIYNNDINYEYNLKLLVGAIMVEEIRAAVYERTGYRCSAGIAHNKILAKLACGMNKPNKQTILPHDSVEELYKNLSIKKIKSLGGKFGNTLAEDLNINFMSELAQFSEKELARRYDEKMASWLYNIARGIDTELVETRLISKSIGCCKKFPGRTALKTLKDVTHWLSELTEEISERLDQDLQENNRKAKQIVVSFAQEIDKKDVHSSRTQPLNFYDAKRILEDSLETLKKYTQKPDGSFHIKFLGLSAGKFDSIKSVNDISTFFTKIDKNSSEENIKSCIKKKQGESGKPKLRGLDSFLNSANTLKYTNTDEKKNSNVDNISSKNNIETKQRRILDGFFSNLSTDKMISQKTTPISMNKNDEVKNIQKNNITSEVVSCGENYLIVKQYTPQNGNEECDKLESGEISLIDIEKDADDCFDFIESVPDKQSDLTELDDCLSTSTVEKDYSCILQNKQEYPFRTDLFNNELEKETTDINRESRDSSPVLQHTADLTNGKSFLFRYFQRFAAVSTPHCIDPDNEENQINDEESKDYNSDGSNYSITDLEQFNNKYARENIDEETRTKNNDQILENNREYFLVENEETELCEECNKNVPISQLTSHRDEHFAFKLMEEEKRLFKEELDNRKQKQLDEQAIKMASSKQKNITTTKQVKRKFSHSDTNLTISSFFQQTSKQVENEPLDVCGECGKQIKFSEMESHLDFHTAKKLHLELNPVKTVHKTKQVNKVVTKKKNNKPESIVKNAQDRSKNFPNFFKKN